MSQPGSPEPNHPHHHHPDTGPRPAHEQQKPYWQRAHKDWRFWVGVVCIAAALVIYIVTNNLSTVPQTHL